MYLYAKSSANGFVGDGSYGLAGSNMKNVAALRLRPLQMSSWRLWVQ